MRDHDRRISTHVRTTIPGLRRGFTLALPAALLGAAALSGCVSDPDCGICDPENLVLESIAGPNYAGQLVKLLGPTCVGDACPGPITEGNYFVDRVIPCLETDAAMKAPRGAEEWCKISPLVVGDGLQLIFNNLLDPTSVELVRRDPENPTLFEVYGWKTRIAHLEGPITRYNGDYKHARQGSDPDVVTRAVNLACIDNLRDQGVAFDHETLASGACEGTFEDPKTGATWPLKTRLGQELKTYGGETDGRSRANSCTPAQGDIDLCCDVCDYELSVNVSKYGVAAPLDALEPASAAQRRSPNPGAAAPALTCDPGGDVFRECRDFIPHVYRGDEVRTYRYDWDGDGAVDPASETFRVPLRDRLREVHPDDRPAGHEQKTVPCETRSDCTDASRADLPGMDCVGVDAEGRACSEGQDCTDRRCVAEWFVDCVADAATTGEQGYCVDQRWRGRGAAACFTTDASYKVCGAGESCEPYAGTAGAGRRFAYADADINHELTALEGCRAALGAGEDFAACDPLYQSGVVPLDRYERGQTLPSQTRECVCEDDPAPGCEELVDRLCRPEGDASKPITDARRGEYALKFVRRDGGVVYDPAVKGVLMRPADLGGVPRSFTEECAEDASRISTWNIKDGWLANRDGFVESYEDFDRAMCSSSEYRVVLGAPGEGDAAEYIRDKLGNTLRGKSTYVLRTPDFHVVPGSGSPPASGRISACETFDLAFSNKYDLAAENLRKLRVVEVDGEGAPQSIVAGGLECVTTAEAFNAGEGPPCLNIDIRGHAEGRIRLDVDFQTFGAVFVPGRRYRIDVPGLELADGETVFEAMKDPARYAAAFHDACGMPLVTSMPRLDGEGLVSASGARPDPDHYYEFEIDPPRCRDDLDLDGYQGLCDNAPKIANRDQRNTDGDPHGDTVDLCPTLADEINTADSDRDGVGNRCDTCPRSLQQYNKGGQGQPYEGYMWIRNIPDQDDFDGDGVGDVCDNCIVRSNCGDFGGDDPEKTPARVGDLVPHDNATACQAAKADAPLIGAACFEDGAPLQLEGAAGPVGIGKTDDFDQDGVANFDDLCPRQRLPACTSDAECGEEIACVEGRCANHRDTDKDGVGDACDTCPELKNPSQFIDGPMQDGDLDGDFIGDQCDGNKACESTLDPRPIAFYTKVAPSGMCCTQTLLQGEYDAPALQADEEPLSRDAEKYFVPLRADCQGQTPDKCRTPPPTVLSAPGVGVLPAGCDGAGEPLHLKSPQIAGDADALYAFACMLPQRDQDFDGVPDACDLCPFVHDPSNAQYVDDNLKTWPKNGAYCSGDWDPNEIDRLYFECGMEDGAGETETGTGGETTGAGESGTTG